MIKENQQVTTHGPVIHGATPRRPKALPDGFAKIHVNAGVRRGRGGATTAVCRDRDGNYLGSSYLVLDGVDDPTTLEAIACREALALAEDSLSNVVHMAFQEPMGA